jgi:hypothetical protein
LRAHVDLTEARCFGLIGEARGAGIVEVPTRHGPIAVTVLGDGHGLPAQVRHLGKGRCKYVGSGLALPRFVLTGTARMLP